MIQRKTLCHLSIAVVTLTSPMATGAQNVDAATKNFLGADANDDGLLVYAEFATFIDLNAADGIGNAARVSSLGLYARAFKRVDANDDGKITPQELRDLQ